MESEIRGYHVYGSSWKPKIGDFLLTDREVSNEDDKFAVAVYEELGFDELRIVGHLPAEFSRTAAYFIENRTPVAHLVVHRAVTREVVSSRLRPDQHSGSLNN